MILIIIGRVLAWLNLTAFVSHYIFGVLGFITDKSFIIYFLCGAIHLIAGVALLKSVRGMKDMKEMKEMKDMEEKEMEDGLHRQSNTASNGGAPEDTSIPNAGATSISTANQTANTFIAITPAQSAHQASIAQQDMQLQMQRALMMMQQAPSASMLYGTTANGGGLGQRTPYYTPTGTAIGLITAAITGTVTVGESEYGKHSAIKYDGVVAGEIIAYRCWPIKNGFLWSSAAERAWAPNEPMAAEDGHLERGLGVYAFKEMSQVIKDFSGMGTVAFGSIELWGEIVEHDIGYRAQYAKIRSIEFVSNGPSGELLRLRQLYQVENPGENSASQSLRLEHRKDD